MNDPQMMIEAVLYGGPVDGAELRIPATLGYLLAALGNQVHGYAWNGELSNERWVYRHHRLLARTGEGTSAAALLRSKGQRVVELSGE